ncbi:MAG: hypothetical protein KQ78_01762 [Candidatus Izimaplasma bacterium HR2]|nr:MAG: hypothetical protein KQ78_01762 [Candidatus Izimaplasma bacterium HR2]
MENKRDKFTRIAENRTNKIIHMVELLGNCSNKRVYDYTEADIKKIFGAIEKQLSLTKSKYKSNNSKGKFKL